MANKIVVNKTLAWNWQDLLKGGVLAAISPVFTIILQSLQAEELTVNWKSILNVAIIAFVSYMLKNLNLIGDPSLTTYYDTNSKVEKVAETIEPTKK